MRKRLIALTAILAGALLTAATAGRFTLLNVVVWGAYFGTLFWPWAFGRTQPSECRFPWSTSSGA